MWVEGEDGAIPESDEESDYSSEDEGDFQYKILEKQRDDVKHKLAKLEEVSNQLLKEMDVLEIQFQIERSCRESAEALAVEVTKENKTLKRRSQMLMPFIPELPENLVAVTCDPQNDPTVNTDVVDFGEDSSDVESLLLESQAKITELQASVDGLLAEKLQLEQQIEDMTKEQDHLREQLALEVEEKEALLRKMNKQSKTMNKIKRVSQLVTEEFTDMSLKLELEEDLRQHAEVFAHQMLVQHNVVDGQNTMQSPETDLQLQQVLEEISNISTALSNIQRYCQNQVKQSQSAVEECTVLSELQNLKNQLEKSEEERKALETQLSDANGTVTRLQEEVNQLQETINRGDTNDEPKMKSIPAPPPPPPLPPPTTPVSNPLDFLRSRKKAGTIKGDPNKPSPLLDLKSKAVDEMMARIRKGIVLRPTQRLQEDDSSWKDQRSENRKSAVLELKGMLDNMKRQHHHRVPSRRGIGRNVGEAELLLVLQRRRRAMAENQDTSFSSQTQNPQSGAQHVPAAGDAPWAGDISSAPVLRRLKQNRELRDSRIRASALVDS